MDVDGLLQELYSRIPPLVEEAAKGLDTDALSRRPAPSANSVGWLLWHLIRVQDHHVSELLHTEQIWTQGDWPRRFGLDPDPDNTGYGHTAADVASVRPENADAITGYLRAVHNRTADLLGRIDADELERVVDDNWDPPVTLGVRLVSVADDSLQHVGQAAYVRGLIEDATAGTSGGPAPR
jgi:hypothetical protein